jgi:hypothetical protein
MAARAVKTSLCWVEFIVGVSAVGCISPKWEKSLSGI